MDCNRVENDRALKLKGGLCNYGGGGGGRGGGGEGGGGG